MLKPRQLSLMLSGRVFFSTGDKISDVLGSVVIVGITIMMTENSSKESIIIGSDGILLHSAIISPGLLVGEILF